MEIKAILLYLLISIGGTCITALIFSNFSSIGDFLKLKLDDWNAKRWKLDRIAISELRSNLEPLKDFQEIRICEKDCFYNENDDNRVFFIKVNKGNIKIGFLINNDFGQNEFIAENVKLHSLELTPERYEAIGLETGFLYIEIKYENFLNWEDEYKRLIELYGEEKIKEIENKFGLLSIGEYLNLIKSKSRKSLKKY